MTQIDSYVPSEACELLQHLLKKNPHTYYHCCRVAKLALSVVTVLTVNPDIVIKTYLAAQFHDVGKLCVPDELLRAPRRLTFDEKCLVDLHSEVGANLCLSMDMDIRRAIALHHTDYCKLGNDELIANVIHVCDVYDAVRHKRAYKEAFSKLDSLNIILKGSGTEFSPSVVGALCSDEIINA